MRNKSLLKALGVLGVVGCLSLGLASCGNDSTGTSSDNSSKPSESTDTATKFDSSKNINLYTRDTTSGTRDGFFTGIGMEDAKADDSLLKEKFAIVSSNGDMISNISGDIYGIGYISLSSLETSGLKGLVYEGVEPTEANVINESYKLTRNFNYAKRASYTNVKEGQIVDAFIAYMNTVDGQTVIKNEGGIIKTASTTLWDDVKSQYSVLTEDTNGITIKLGGSSSVKSIVEQLVTEFNAMLNGAKLEYNGTGSGDAYKGITADETAANALDLGFASREFKTSEPISDENKGTMCTDAIVAVVNKANSLISVTATQLVNMYSKMGTFNKWSDVK